MLPCGGPVRRRTPIGILVCVDEGDPAYEEP